MPKQLLVGLILCAMLLPACQSERNSASAEKVAALALDSLSVAVDNSSSFTVNVDGLRLRKSHGPDADVIRALEKGETLYDLGAVSGYTTAIRLRGIDFNEPWIKVQTMRGEEGWVYGGALHAELNGTAHTAFMLMEKRLTTMFGADMEAAISDYRIDYQSMKSAEDFAQAYRRGIRLRDSIVTPLERSIEVGAFDELPDLFWLEQVMPGFQPTLVAEGTSYYLFADYRDWVEKATETSGEMDDAFIDLAIQFYQGDSVEYFYPAFFLQTWDYGGHSLLGRGIHLHLLNEMETFQQAYPGHFSAAIHSFLQQLVDDMTAAHVTYWEPAEAIVEELEQIAEKQWTMFTKEHNIAINTRLQQFRKPEKYNLQTNYKSGLTQ